MYRPRPAHFLPANTARNVVPRRGPPMRPGSRRTDPGDIRCGCCETLLAREEDGAITVDRGGQKSVFRPDEGGSCYLICHQPWCRALTIVHVSRRGIEVEPA